MSNINLIQNKLNLVSNNFSLISDNVANINTPGYKRKYIDIFESDFSNNLNSKLKKTHENHIDTSDRFGANVNVVDAHVRTDENGVNIDTEVIELNKTNLFYKSLVSLLNNDISNKKNIINS